MTESRHLTPVPTDPPPGDDGGTAPPHNPEYERQVLGSALTHPGAAEELRAHGVVGSCFYTPAHEQVWHAILTLTVTGRPATPETVTEELRRRKALTRPMTTFMGGNPLTYLWGLVNNAPVSPDVALYYADRLRSLAARRRHMAAATRALQAALTNDEDDAHLAILEALRAHVSDEDTRLRSPAEQVPGTDIDTFLATGDEAYAWLIPGFLERQDRLIVTAGEGKGKSTLLRQLGVQFASGIHPFDGEPYPPLRVLHVDLENTARQTRRKLRPLRVQAGDRLHPSRYVIECRTEGLDLTTVEDRAWLDHVVAHHRPDVLITGPIYKLAGGNPNAEEDAKPVALALDALRASYDLAIILEAHTAKAQNGARNRPREPVGWSGWMRWPELGIHLGDDGTITHWRGARDERDIPEFLTRGGAWPWSPSTHPHADRFTTIVRACRAAGEVLSNREIARRTGISEATVRRTLQEFAAQWEGVKWQLSPEPDTPDEGRDDDPTDRGVSR